MSNINLVALSGRLGKDPEAKYFESGTNKTWFSIAVNKWDKKENKEIANWFDIEIWGKNAEYIAEYAKAGALVFVEGRLDIQKWEKDGEPRSKVVVIASNIELVKTN